MTGDVVCIIVGGIFLLLAIAGKLDIFRRLVVGGLPAWSRIVAAVVGTGLMVVGIVSFVDHQKGGGNDGSPSVQLSIASPLGEVEVLPGEQVKIVVRGTMVGTLENPAAYTIYVLVHPLEATEYWVQKPGASVSASWEAIAYLGGIGQYSARDGEKFQLVAVITDRGLRDRYSDTRDFKIVSEPVTVTVRRPTS